MMSFQISRDIYRRVVHPMMRSEIFRDICRRCNTLARCLLHWVHILHISYITCLMHLCADIWSINMSTQVCLHYHVLLLTIMLTKILHSYWPGVSSHPSGYNTSVLQMGKPIISRRPSFVSRGTPNIFQVGTCQAWDIITFMSLCGFSSMGWWCCNYGYFISCICAISQTCSMNAHQNRQKQSQDCPRSLSQIDSVISPGIMDLQHENVIATSIKSQFTDLQIKNMAMFVCQGAITGSMQELMPTKISFVG